MARRLFNSARNYFGPLPPPTAIQQLQAELDTLPPGTTRVDLSGRGLTTETLAGVRFPDSILELTLRENLIDSLDGVTFPARLRMLDLERNNIQQLHPNNFPDGLRALYIHGNPAFNNENMERIDRPGLRLRAQDDDHHYLALPDEVYRRRHRQARVARQLEPIPLPPQAVLAPLRIARTYQEYKTIMTAEGNTEAQCREAECTVCAAPFVDVRRMQLLQPVFFHETHANDGRVMWSHPHHLDDMAQLQPNRNGFIPCPDCRELLDITPQQAAAIRNERAATGVQRVVRGHLSRRQTRHSSSKRGGKKYKARHRSNLSRKSKNRTRRNRS